MDTAQNIPNPVISSFRIDPTDYPIAVRNSVATTHKLFFGTLVAAAIPAVCFTFAAAPIWSMALPIVVIARLAMNTYRNHLIDNRLKKDYSDMAHQLNEGFSHSDGIDLRKLGIVDNQGNLSQKGHILTLDQMINSLIQDVKNISLPATVAKCKEMEVGLPSVHGRAPLFCRLCNTYPAHARAS